VGIALIERLVELGGFVLSAAASGQHAHLQAKLLPAEVRETAGLAKIHAWFELRDHDWKGKLWGKSGKAKRIRDREHHRHASRGRGDWLGLPSYDSSFATSLRLSPTHPYTFVRPLSISNSHFL